MDFKGRANLASVKNCQFIVSEPAGDDNNNGNSNTNGAQNVGSFSSMEDMLKAEGEKDFVLQLGKVSVWFVVNLVWL